ncbi:MAG: hypothetical protein MJB57_01280, partial [Gemmatimonadetes bacterium]|nr:hypothetical protein [Gemmatimonadota bacterium]
MRICLLTNQDLDSETIAEHDWPADPRPYLPDAEWDLLVLEKETAVRQVLTAALNDYDVYFNLCDGAWDEETPGIEVVKTLERLDVPFTGATSEFFEPSREAMKRVCRAWDIDTPAYAFVYDEHDVQRAAEELTFPLFVKHPSSYASIGLTKDSKVDTPADLALQAGIMITQYGSALVEEFIDGTEYTVLVAENAADPTSPIAYQSVGYRFPKGESFKHSDLKWIEYERMETFAVADPGLDRLLKKVSSRFFQALNGASYGRCDIRLDREGRPFMLEINANCGMFYSEEDAGSADFCLFNDPRGHEGFTRAIVDAAIARHRHRARNWRVVPKNGDYATVATRDIMPGESILSYEGEPHTLVSLSHVEATWADPELEWFSRYAWPLTDELWVTWSRDPHEWMPVNHGCDPSAWFEGLDVVARRNIARGEEITMD